MRHCADNALEYGCAFSIESRFSARSIHCPPDSGNESGSRAPLQSLNLHSAVPPAVAKGLQERIGNDHVTQLLGHDRVSRPVSTPGPATRSRSSPRRLAGRAPGPRCGWSGRMKRSCRPARRVSFRSATRCCPRDTSTIRRRTATRSSPKAGSAPATLAVVDADGNVAITARCEDIINRGGRQVQPPGHRRPARRSPSDRHGRNRAHPGPGAGRARVLPHDRRRRRGADTRIDLRVPRRERGRQGSVAGNASRSSTRCR